MSDSTKENQEYIEDNRIIKLSDELLASARASIENDKSIIIPIDKLSTLGTGVSSLAPSFRSVTQKTTFNDKNLYKITNLEVNDILKKTHNGNFLGVIYKDGGGIKKYLQLQNAGSISTTTETIAAFNPAIIMMAATLFTVEKRLSNIEKMQKEIITFLETEKESGIEADVQMLSDTISKYKSNWNNEQFITNSHKLVIDIQRTARKNINSYKKNVSEIIDEKQWIIIQSQVASKLKELKKKFNYYRLSIYIYSLSSLLEIMLSGNFNEEYVIYIKCEIEQLSNTYRELFGKCSKYLEEMSNSSVETNVLKGVGNTSKAIGKLANEISFLKGGSVEKFLKDGGSKLKTEAKTMNKEIEEKFSKISNPETKVFIDKMNDIIQIFNHTKNIYFGEKNIYLIAE